jgi:hypothetical protein
VKTAPACLGSRLYVDVLWGDKFHALSVTAQTAVIQEDKGRESVASSAETNGNFGPLPIAPLKRPQSAPGFVVLLPA